MILLVGCQSKQEIDNHGTEGERHQESENKERETGNIETEYFTLEVPSNWKNLYSYETNVDNEIGDLSIHVYMTSNNEFGKAHLFTVYVLSTEFTDNVATALDGWIEPIGLISNENNEEYLLGFSYASEQTCEEDEIEEFLEFTNGILGVIETLSPKGAYVFEEWDNTMMNELGKPPSYEAYVPISFNVLDWSFEAYKNQAGTVLYEVNAENLKSFNYSENIIYYRGGNELVGVEDGEIVLYSFAPDAMSGVFSGTSVRDIIKDIGIVELFEVTPQIVSVDNDAVSFYYWTGDGGYIGIVAVGGNNPAKCYDYYAQQVIVYEDSNIISFFQ